MASSRTRLTEATGKRRARGLRSSLARRTNRRNSGLRGGSKTGEEPELAWEGRDNGWLEG